MTTKAKISAYFSRITIILLLALSQACDGKNSETASGTNPQSISVTPADPSIPYGTSIQFKAEGIFSDGSKQDLTSQVNWLSSDPTVTITPAGLARSTAQGAITSTISAAIADATGQTILTVKNVNLTSLTLEPQYILKSPAFTVIQQYIATGGFSDNSVHDVTNDVAWSSSNTTVAVVDAKGWAACHSDYISGCMGVATITATAEAPLNFATAWATLSVGVIE